MPYNAENKRRNRGILGGELQRWPSVDLTQFHAISPLRYDISSPRVDPSSGRVTAIAIDPTDANVAYVGAPRI